MFWLPLVVCFAAPTVPVKVINPDGTPATGAQVWAYPNTDRQKKAAPEPTPVVTGADGTARTDLGFGPTNSMTELFAKDATGRIGSAYVFQSNPPKPIVITLVPVADRPGRVVDEDGKPIAGATVSLNGATGEPKPGEREGSNYVTVPHWEAAKNAARTDADGRFILKGVPVGYRPNFTVNAGARGEMRYFTGGATELNVVHRKTGGVKITVQGADPATLTKLQWDVVVVDAASKRANGVYPSLYKSGQQTGAAEQVVRDIVPGRYTMTLHRDASLPLLVAPVDPFDVKAGENTSITLKCGPAATIRGTVTGPDGKGLPGVSVAVDIQPSIEAQRQNMGVVTTADDGTFTAYGPTGLYSSYVNRLPDGFVNPPFNPRAARPKPVRSEIGQEHTFPPHKLDTSVSFVAKVVDAAGKPLGGVDVYLPFGSEGRGRLKEVTDADGTLRVKQLHPSLSVNPRIPVGNAANTPQVYRLADHDRPVTIVVSEANAGAVAGRVTDASGTPIPGASVKLQQWAKGHGQWESMSNNTIPAKTVTTDAKGEYRFGGLLIGDRPQVTVTAVGYADGEIPAANLDAGQTTTLRDIKLIGTQRSVSGVVVNTAGKPVAGATVFAVDGVKPMETKTAADGGFTLAGFYDAPGFLFAEAPDFRIIALPVQPKDKTPVRVVLRRTAEPPTPIVIPKEHLEADKRLTRHVLETMVKTHKTHGLGISAVAHMAEYDLPTAQKWVAEEKERSKGENDWAGYIRRAEVRKSLAFTAKDDLDEAISVLQKMKPESGYSECLFLANQLLPGEPKKALRVLEEAVVKARSTAMPTRVSWLAHAGEALARAGDPDGARKIIEEAVALAAEVPSDGRDRNSVIYGCTAAALAPYDWPRAKAMIEKMKDTSERNRYYGAAAVRFAATDLPQAKEIMKLMERSGSFEKECSTIRMALRLAKTKPDDATDLVEGIAEPGYRIAGYSQLAHAIAPQDKPRAVALIDKAMKLLESKPEHIHYWSKAAEYGLYVAVSGQRIGHPDVPGLTARALAMRTRGDRPPSAEERIRGQVNLACGYALIDPAVARHLLAGVAPPDEFVKKAANADRNWVFALALSDPERGIQLLDDRLAWMTAQRDGKMHTFNGISELSSILTAPDRMTELGRWAQIFHDVRDED